MKRSKEYLNIDEARQRVLLFVSSNGAHAFYKKDKGFRVFNVGRMGSVDEETLKMQVAPQRERVIGWLRAAEKEKSIAYCGFFQTGKRKYKGKVVDFTPTFDYQDMTLSLIGAVQEVQYGRKS